MLAGDTVCPRCGAAADDNVFCSGCGLNLRLQGELPTAEAFAARQREQAWLAEQDAQRAQTGERAEREVEQCAQEGQEVGDGEVVIAGDYPGVHAHRGSATVRERSEEAAGSQGSQGRTARRKWLSALLVIVVMAAGVAAGGYAFGRASGADLDATRAVGERVGQARGAEGGQKRGYEAGFEEGRREAYEQAEQEAEEGEANATETEAPTAEAEGTVSCDRVQVTPNSDDAMYDIEAAGIDCESVEELLLEWGQAEYLPVKGPPGYACTTEDLRSLQARSTCQSDSGQQTISFTQGP